MNGFWYLGEDGKNMHDIIYIRDCESKRRKPQPFLVTAIGHSTKKIDSVTYRNYYVIQPNRRKSDKTN